MNQPEPTPAPESTEDSTSDEAAQEALAALAQEAGDGNDSDSDGEGEDDEQFDAARARRKIEKVNREAKALREQLKQLKPLAEEAEKRRRDEQTEAQRLTEEKAELEVQLAELRTAAVRREAAEAAGLPARLAKYISAADEDEAHAQAKELAKEIKADEQAAPPKTDFRQGARGSTSSGNTQNRDDLLRQMARPH